MKEIVDAAKETSIDYKPWIEDLSPQEYFEEGFKRGAEWFNNYKELHPIWMWNVRVINDKRPPNFYVVPATSSKDARLMAFILDRSLREEKYGQSSIVDHRDLELALEYTTILSSSGV